MTDDKFVPGDLVVLTHSAGLTPEPGVARTLDYTALPRKGELLMVICTVPGEDLLDEVLFMTARTMQLGWAYGSQTVFKRVSR